MIQMALDTKFATTVGGSTAAISMFDLVQGGVSIFAIAAGAILSLSLIFIHWERRFSDNKEKAIRDKLTKEETNRKRKSDELEIETLNLKIKVLKMELKDEKSKKSD